MSELNRLTIAEARDALAKGETTAVELTEACLSAIDGSGALNAFVHHTPDMARDMARAADQRIKAGDAAPMTGIPVGVKDVFCVKGVPSQAGSRILQGFTPEYESTVTQNLWNAGAVMLGAQVALTERWSVFGEYKATYSVNEGDLDGGGTIETDVVTNALNLGVSYRF